MFAYRDSAISLSFIQSLIDSNCAGTWKRWEYTVPALLLEVCVWWCVCVCVCVFSLCVRETMRTREEEEWERKKERTPVSVEM